MATSAPNKFKELSNEMSKSRQGILYKETLQHIASQHKVRIEIYSDSYKFQCYARIEVFHPQELKWNKLEYIPSANMATPEQLVYSVPVSSSVYMVQNQFMVDRNKLLQLANTILE